MTPDYWKAKLTGLDTELCQAIQLLTGRHCEPKNGGDHYFIEIDYRNNADQQHILTICDLIEKQAGARLTGLKDYPERQCLLACIAFVVNNKH